MSIRQDICRQINSDSCGSAVTADKILKVQNSEGKDNVNDGQEDMLTYNFENINVPLYEHIYKCIRDDVVSGRLKPDEKLPSKRAFAENNGVSIITVQNAYEQLIEEGYIYARPRQGYYVSDLKHNIRYTEGSDARGDMLPDIVSDGHGNAGYAHISEGAVPCGTQAENHAAKCGSGHAAAADAYNAAGSEENIHDLPEKAVNAAKYRINLSDNRTDPARFPFSVWAKLMRNVISGMEGELMTPPPTGGVLKLRQAIADYLRSFRGINADPDSIIVGAGTEYLYGLLIQLLGNDRIYCIENPGYKKLTEIYAQYGIECRYADMDDEGIVCEELTALGADIAHISPTHHFPTGISMPAARRYELLSWAYDAENRYIIEDDYDSEFRQNGKPVPPLISMDRAGKVIYMNTFSKSLTPTIRISYMVLPPRLAALFYRKLGFYACTVSNFEQYTLARFISMGYFEKHINRMRLYYRRQRQEIMRLISDSGLSDKCRIIENDAGLHFILELATDKTDADVKAELAEHGINIRALSDYYLAGSPGDLHRFLINYSNIAADELKEAFDILPEVL